MIRKQLRKIARRRLAYWHEAASIGPAFLPAWHPALEKSTAKYYLWRDRVDRLNTR